MIAMLARLFIRNRENTSDPAVRSAYGILCSACGILLNLLLFAGKYAAGLISSSVSITADAFNNLSDAASSVVTLLGFRFAARRPDEEHPFGHGRIEYISGFIVSLLILLMGFELAQSSVGRILNPEPVQNGLLPCVVLGVSILAKLYMFLYNRRVSRLISSAAMMAAARDSLFDCVSTAVVLASAVLAQLTGLQLDGWCGVLVALVIFRGGFSAAKETLSPLLGRAPDAQLVRRIEEIVMENGAVTGIHDLVVHDYGPGRCMISLHGEVPADGDLIALHDAVDLIERRLCAELGCSAVIHMDPVSTSDERVNALRARVEAAAAELDGRLSIHDFRIVEGPTHTNLIFDVVVPPGYALTDAQTQSELAAAVRGLGEEFCAVIEVDHAYI